jgi:hypothetical protein
MAYIITILKPVYSKHGGLTSPTGRAYDMESYSTAAVTTMNEVLDSVEGIIDDAQDALGEEEGARAYFTQARSSAAALNEEEGGRVELPNGEVIEIEFWGAARAVNWMVENGYDPQTKDFITTYNDDKKD